MVALILSLVLSTQSPMSYDEGYLKAEAEGKPLLVLVGAAWCAPCRRMKSALHDMSAEGEFKNVVYVYVDVDEHPEVAAKIKSGDSIPQLACYSKGKDGWKCCRLQGLQSKIKVRGLVKKALDH